MHLNFLMLRVVIMVPLPGGVAMSGCVSSSDESGKSSDDTRVPLEGDLDIEGWDTVIGTNGPRRPWPIQRPFFGKAAAAHYPRQQIDILPRAWLGRTKLLLKA